MKLWLPKWLREERPATDMELESTDRRLFLRGLTLTSAGLVVGVPLISIPQPLPYARIVAGIDWGFRSRAVTFLVVGTDIVPGSMCVENAKAQGAIVVDSVQAALASLPKHGDGRSVQIMVKRGARIC